MKNEIIMSEDQQAQSLAPMNPMQLLTVAVDKGLDVAQLEKLMDLDERYKAQQAKREFQKALSGFQSEAPAIKKLKSGHNIKYAPLEDILAQVKGLLAKWGLAYRWEQSQEDGNITVTTIVTHLDGHSESLAMTASADSSGSKNAIQGIGSTVTYLRRYGLTGALGIVVADEDSDGRVSSVVKVDTIHADKLKERGELAGIDTAKMLMHFQVDSLEELTKAQYDQANRMVSARIAQNKEASE